MGKVKHRFIVLLIVLLLIISALVSIYFFVFPTISFIADDTWLQCLTRQYNIELRISYALKGCRLKFVKLAPNVFYNKEDFCSILEKNESLYVVLSPLCSYFAIENEIDVSSLLDSSIVLGISSFGNNYFDALLVSDEKTAWLEASSIIAKETQLSSHNVALVYESSVIDYGDDIKANFSPNTISLFDKTESGNLYYENVKKELDDQVIVLALCPYVSGFENFFTGKDSVSWVVDYRFSLAVPKDYCYAVIRPVLTNLDSLVSEVKKAWHGNLTLEFEYEKL